MIIIASVLGGSVIGYRTGADRRGTRLFLIVWVAVFVFQTALLLATSDDPRNRNTGAWELGYFPFAFAVLVLGFAVLQNAGALRRRLVRRRRRSSMSRACDRDGERSYPAGVRQP